ncbi:MAG: stage II sporulation protein E [Syntrophomonas sp.]|nr:stage II sporulation protein E [Syntrophomonas sp.]
MGDKMLEKTEIYPYQRVAEKAGNRSRGKKHEREREWRQTFKESTARGKTWLRAFLKKEGSSFFHSLLSLENLVLAVGALILSRAFVLGDLLPFVYAYLAVFAGKEKGRAILLLAFATLGLSSVLHGFDLGSSIVSLLVLIAVLKRLRILPEKAWWMLPLVSISVLFTSKSLFLLGGEFSLYAEMVVVFEAVIAGVLCFVFTVAHEAIAQRKPLASLNFEEFASFLVLGIGLVMGLNNVHLAGLSVSSIICRLGIMLAALLWGSGGGTIVGVMTGIIPSISSSIFAQSLGMYAVSGLLAGLFRNLGRLGIVLGFMLGTMALSMFIPETSATILGIWETAIASLLFFLLPESLQDKMPLQALGPLNGRFREQDETIDSRLEESARKRIENLAAVFEELSSSFSGEMEVKRKNHQAAYLNYLYEQVSQNFCEKCSRYDNCWGRDSYHSSQQILELFSIVEKAELSYEKAPRDFKRRCLYAREMISTINYLFDRLLLNEYWSDKLCESRELVATQLKGVSQVIKGLAQEIDVKTEFDLEIREKLLRESKQQGLKIKEMTPLRSSSGQLLLNVVADPCREGEFCKTNIAPSFSNILGERMEVCEKTCPRFRAWGQCKFTMSRACSYKVSSGVVQVGKEAVCGDSFTIASLKEGKELIALSDGMGVGEKACCESQATVRLLENLLESGFQREVALNTINTVLLLRSAQESFATLDMIMVDLYNGDVDFIKVGSAPSYIKRDKKVGMISSHSLPIGILENVDVVSERHSLCPRDILVMVSDGVLEVSRQFNETWIMDFLSQVDESDPQLLAEMIMNKALGMCKGKPADDMTVICLRVELQ